VIVTLIKSLGFPGKPQDQAEPTSFLPGPDARFICGSLLFVDGGHDAVFRPCSIYANSESCKKDSALACGLQRLVYVSQNIVDMLDADGQPDHLLADACGGQFLRIQLTVGGAGGVTGE